ncbi:MAG TPA: hypothetical protein VMC62_08710 [Longilinea sp.]|nr:hypothetical protein [Longilinea sp.]
MMPNEGFGAEVENSIRAYEAVNSGHRANNARPMIAQYGEIEALSRLMKSGDLQQGFKALRDSGQLDKTFEALITTHPELFDQGIVEAAQWRLDHPYGLLENDL